MRSLHELVGAQLAKGGKVKGITRRDLLKGLGAVGVTGVAIGKAARHTGTDPLTELKAIEKAIESPAVAKSAVKATTRSFKLGDIPQSLQQKIRKLFEGQTDDYYRLAKEDDPNHLVQADIGESILDIDDPNMTFTGEQVDFVEDALDLALDEPEVFGLTKGDLDSALSNLRGGELLPTAKVGLHLEIEDHPNLRKLKTEANKILDRTESADDLIYTEGMREWDIFSRQLESEGYDPYDLIGIMERVE